MEKTCTHCHELLPVTAFPQCSLNGKRYYRGKCKNCKNATKRQVTLARHLALPQKPLPDHKVCSRCKRDLPQEAFYRFKAISYHRKVTRLLTRCKDCHRAIMGHNKKPESLVEAFQRHANIGIPDECWIWTGTRTRNRHTNEPSYGVFQFDGIKYRAHRVAYELRTGETIPPDMQACHTCDNPPCVNPDHLFIGTNQDNIADSTVKGRKQVVGSTRNRPAKLTIEQIYTIKQVAYTIRAVNLAKLYGVDRHTITSIWRGDTWPDIEDLFRRYVAEKS